MFYVIPTGHKTPHQQMKAISQAIAWKRERNTAGDALILAMDLRERLGYNFCVIEVNQIYHTKNVEFTK